MSIENRLLEWARWRHEPGIVCASGVTPMGRIQDDHRNAGARPSGFAYQMIGAVPCMPDGGVGEMVERMANALDHDKRAREVQQLIRQMPTDYQAIVEVIYNGLPREIPRDERDASRRMNISRPVFRERRAKMIGWIEGSIAAALHAGIPRVS